MPIDSGLTDALLVKYFHLGYSDKKIASMHGITVQAVSKRRVKLGLTRKPVSKQVNQYLAQRWTVKTTTGPDSHHNMYSAQRLREWLRYRLGDESLSPYQLRRLKQWEHGLRERGEVLCYDPGREMGWYYRPRTSRDGRLVIDWPKELPFPDDKFREALELPPEPVTESC